MKNNKEHLCQYCETETTKHPRCLKCFILLHKADDKYKCHCGRQHTLVSENDSRYCKECL